MKSGGALVAKIFVIDRQHTPTARLCSPRAIRSRKDRRLVSWTQTMHKSYFLAFFAYLGFQVANIFTSVYWPSELVTKINAILSSWSLEGFQIFEIGQTLQCSWCMILSLFCMITKVYAYLFPFILRVQTKYLHVAMPFKYSDHVHM